MNCVIYIIQTDEGGKVGELGKHFARNSFYQRRCASQNGVKNAIFKTIRSEGN